MSYDKYDDREDPIDSMDIQRVCETDKQFSWRWQVLKAKNRKPMTKARQRSLNRIKDWIDDYALNYARECADAKMERNDPHRYYGVRRSDFG